MNKTEILLVSGLCSDNKYAEIRELRTRQSLDPSLRVFGALVKGLAAHDVDVTCISALPLSPRNTTLRLVPPAQEDCVVRYIYLGFRNSTVARMNDMYRNAKREVELWIRRTEGRRRYIICDSLLLMCSLPARRLGQRHAIKTIAYVTDYPSMATAIKGKQSLTRRIVQGAFDRLADRDLKGYDGYVLVAEPLKELIGKKAIQYTVIEGIVDIPIDRPIHHRKDGKQVLVYAGALCPRFGVNKLADAISMIQDDNLVMNFYGSGESEQYIMKKHQSDPRINYCGNVSFEEIAEIQKQADLLVNPRPSDELFVRYSFPSKVLSYLVSKTPVLCTRLPGIPKDYSNLMYWFDDESTEGMSRRIQEIMSIPREKRLELSQKAYEYVTANKNGTAQASRLLRFLSGLDSASHGTVS